MVKTLPEEEGREVLAAVAAGAAAAGAVAVAGAAAGTAALLAAGAVSAQAWAAVTIVPPSRSQADISAGRIRHQHCDIDAASKRIIKTEAIPLSG
jgi:hypothetical protein